jgi:hypothetical protein
MEAVMSEADLLSNASAWMGHPRRVLTDLRRPYRQHAMRTCWLLAVSSNTLSGHAQLAA